MSLGFKLFQAFAPAKTRPGLVHFSGTGVPHDFNVSTRCLVPPAARVSGVHGPGGEVLWMCSSTDTLWYISS